MCGRFTLRTPAHILAHVFDVTDVPVYSPRYNIAPTQDVLAVTLNDQQKRGFVLFRWGLIPSWADDPKIGSRMINARAESVRTKPSFRQAFKHNRCLILADGFFEWQKQGATKQPMLIGQRDGRPFACGQEVVHGHPSSR
jgi:putative SOS response-associated peptidase YedK